MTPTLFRTGNLNIRIYPKDHNPPHVHVVGNDGVEAKFSLNDLECFYSRGFTKNALNRVQNFLIEHQESLLEAWYDYQK